MEYTFLDFLTLIGSVGLFLYGMKVMSEGLQKVAGDRLRNILAVMTKNRFSGMFTGILITALIQSSSASTVMVVSFVNAGLMTLGQSMAVIMGANVGTTVTAWIISIFGFKVNITLFALPLIGLGTPLLFSRNSTHKSWGEFLIGFSFLFMGLDYLNHSVPDLKSNPEIFEFLTSYTQMGFLSILIFCAVGAIVTMIVQASSATLAISLIMCSKGWITFDIAAALILGSNIGTTITPLLASISANVSAKRAAMGHLLFNVLGSIWTLILYYPFIRFIVWICTSLGVGNPNDLMAFVSANEQTNPSLINALNNGGTLHTPDFEQQKAHFEAMQFSVSFGLSMFHTVFNVINVTIMIWFTGLYEKIVTRLVRVKDKKGEEEFQLKFISRGMLSASELNLPQAHQEIAVYAERVQRMFGMVEDLLHEKEGSEAYMKLYNRIEKYEQICDRMELEIAGFLNLVVGGRLSFDGKMRVNSMLSIVTEIESIGDCCYNLARTLQRKQDSHIVFNDEIIGNIDAMFKLNAEALNNMVLLLSSNEPTMSEIMVSYNKECEINNFRNQLRKSNIENINNKHYEYQAGIYYMDMVAECERLGDYVINVVDAIKQQEERHA
ncbi:Na+-dependent phosphate transporter [Barnesiella viscericola DSM 18177]|uniref:Na+-dependent phosphate transporter n=2 Tax=Barnesiella viscericola TaxID=397865 RepID=W0EPB5_9BACT|nr:Na/Pi cotransporter family protein [Barnesiella viscericola]AHF12602.1 Na+-dependent phosphate transporter [Barnesiella viscericola DSM 18177]